MIAAWGGHSSIVTELIGAGAQIDAQDQVAACVCVLNFGNPCMPRLCASLEAPQHSRHKASEVKNL